jgi:MYXO-CTERM domain-containing protein
MTLALAALLLVLADWGSHLAGDSVIPGGPLDESAHLLTTLLVVWALGPTVATRFLGAALVASVAIDLDHVPQHLGTQLLTAGTPRPYTHSLLTVLVVLVLGVVWRRRRRILCGVALGLLVHFWRDLGEPGTGVSLLWPVSHRGFSLPHWSYVAVMTVVVAGVAWRLAWHRRADMRPGARAAYKAAD